MDAPAERQTFLTEDLELDHHGRRLRILKVLKAGASGEVYQGELSDDDQTVPVAVKVMRNLEFPEARSLFEQEGRTLAELDYWEDHVNQEQGDTLKVSPHFYGQGIYEERPYLVMELIQGQELPDLLEEQNGRLPEWQALTIGWHLFRTIDILHTHLKKTYIDLKKENLWWGCAEGETEPSQLRLIDFGTLDPIDEADGTNRGVKRDVLQGAVYLFNMLSGYTIDVLSGELKERPEPVLRRTEGEISWGTIQILKRLFHRNLEHRLMEANEAALALEGLVDLWTNSSLDLFRVAEKNLNAAAQAQERNDPDEKVRSFAYRAKSALSIIERRGEMLDEVEKLERMRARADEFLASNALKAGHFLFEAGSYEQARTVLEKELGWSDQPAVLRRWATLNRLAGDLNVIIQDPDTGISVQDALKKAIHSAREAVDLFNETTTDVELQQAAQRLEEIRAQFIELTLPPQPALEALRVECNLEITLRAADQAYRQHRYEQAEKAYQSAYSQLEKLKQEYPDYVALLVDDFDMDLRRQQERMQKLHQTILASQESLQSAEKMLQTQNGEKAIELVVQSYSRNRWTCSRALHVLVDTAIRNGFFQTAVQISQIGISGPVARSENKRELVQRGLALRLQNIHKAILQDDQLTAFSIIREIMSRQDFQEVPSCNPGLKICLKDLEILATKQEDPEALQDLAGLWERLPDSSPEEGRRLREKARQLQVTQKQAAQKAVDDLLVRANLFLTMDVPESALSLTDGSSQLEQIRLFQRRYERACALLKCARDISMKISYRIEEIAQLEQQAQREFEISSQSAKQSARFASESQAVQKDQIMEVYRTACNLRTWKAEPKGWGCGGEVSNKIDEDLQQLLNRLLTLAYNYLDRFDCRDEEVLEAVRWAISAMDGLSRQNWQSLQDLAQNKLVEIDNYFAEIKNAFENGNLPQAQALLDRAEGWTRTAPEWRHLQQEITRVLAWQSWQNRHETDLSEGKYESGLLEGLARFAGESIPHQYLNSRLVVDYFKQLNNVFRQKTAEALDDYRAPSFIKIFQSWREVERIAQLFSEGKPS